MTLLSKRELEIIGLAADGFADKEIAVRCGITIATVGTYWSRIRSKTNALSRTHAVCICLGVRPPIQSMPAVSYHAVVRSRPVTPGRR